MKNGYAQNRRKKLGEGHLALNLDEKAYGGLVRFSME